MYKHGEISFTWQNDILIVKVKGPFNEESIAHYAPILKDSVLNRSVDKWKRLEFWNDEALGCPKTLALAKEVFDWYEMNGCTLTAVVISNVLQKRILKDIFQSNAEIFVDKNKAIEWLNTHNEPVTHKF
jgi:hypothetical protein